MRKYIPNNELHRTAVDLVANLITAIKNHPEYGAFEIHKVSRPTVEEITKKSLGKEYKHSRVHCGDVYIYTYIKTPLGQSVKLKVGIECGTDNSSSYGSDSRYSDIKDLYRVGDLGVAYGNKIKQLRKPETAIEYALELLKDKYNSAEKDINKNTRRWWAYKHLTNEFNVKPNLRGQTWIHSATIRFDQPKWMRNEWDDYSLLTDQTFDYVIGLKFDDDERQSEPTTWRYRILQSRGKDTYFETAEQVKEYISRDIYNLCCEVWNINTTREMMFKHHDKTFRDLAFMDGDGYSDDSDRLDCQK